MTFTLKKLVPIVAGMATLSVGAAVPPSADAAWPGREGRIALVVSQDDAPSSEYEERIVTVRPDGSDPLVVRQCKPAVGSPCEMPHQGAIAWSPDGQRMAVVVEGRIAVVGADGADWQVITRDDSNAAQPAWSPNGRRLALIRTARDGSSDVVTMRPDGTGARRLTTSAGATDVAWSAKGDIAYATTQTGSLVKIDARGRHRRVLTRAENPGSLDWSPDGERLLFTRKDPGVQRFSTWSVDRRGGRSKRQALAITNAFWSPTGRRIASEGDDTFNLSRLDGTNLRRIDLDPKVGQWGFPVPQAWQALPR